MVKYCIGVDEMTKIITCEICGCEKETNKPTARFCGDKCRNKWRRLNNKSICKRCGKSFKGDRLQYCSDECRIKPEEHKVNNYVPKPKHVEVCVNCNKEYETHSTSSKYCSYGCRYEYKVKQKPVHNIKCKECGKWFSSTNKRKTYCSTKCGDKHDNRLKEMRRRKRIRRNGKIDWDISVERLVKRDNGICYLCGEKVKVNANTNDDYYPSIEHVLPISKGGTHTWNNVKLAHRICNSLKADKVI